MSRSVESPPPKELKPGATEPGVYTVNCVKSRPFNGMLLMVFSVNVSPNVALSVLRMGCIWPETSTVAVVAPIRRGMSTFAVWSISRANGP